MTDTSILKFNEEEIGVLRIYLKPTKAETLEEIYKAVPHIDNNDMRSISENVIAKLTKMTDDEFTKLYKSEQEE